MGDFLQYCRTFLMLALPLSLALAHDKNIDINDLRAAIVFKIMHFISWPKSTQENLTICATKGKMANSLLHLKEHRETSNSISVVAITTNKIPAFCQLLYVSEQSIMDSAIKKIQKKSILTVSHLTQFAKKGGMIELFNKDKKIRFRINLTQVKKSNIRVSSQLLSLSDIIY